METNNITVVESNTLIDGSYKLSIDELRLINLAASKVNSVGVFNPEYIIVTAKEFSDTYNIDLASVYKQIRKAASTAHTKSVTLYEKGDTINRPWFSEIRYSTTGDCSHVKIIFGELIRPHLYELSKDFTQVKLRYLANLDTPFSLRLYLWLSRAKNLNKNIKNGKIECLLSIDDMKERSGLADKHKDYRKFKSLVIQPAINKINQYTDLVVSFEGVRTGLKTTAIKFTYSTSKPKTTLKLPPRPRVKVNSHLEGKYARECINLILGYELETDSLSKVDAKKLIKFFSIVGDKLAVDHYKNKYQL